MLLGAAKVKSKAKQSLAVSLCVAAGLFIGTWYLITSTGHVTYYWPSNSNGNETIGLSFGDSSGQVGIASVEVSVNRSCLFIVSV